MATILCLCFSGYGSQAVSSTTLSSDDSMSLRSISADDTPETEVPKLTNGQVQLAVAVAADQLNTNGASTASDLLSPPDVSLTSISPGEETDATVTVGKFIYLSSHNLSRFSNLPS